MSEKMPSFSAPPLEQKDMNTVEDPKKAEAMAYDSKDAEEADSGYNQKAENLTFDAIEMSNRQDIQKSLLERGAAVDSKLTQDQQILDALSDSSKALKDEAYAKQRADEIAAATADAYDKAA